MVSWESLLTPPGDFADGPPAADWFARVADRLLNGCQLLANGHAHRLVEIEIYYHGPAHPDPFAHRDPVQLHKGRWYFHRTRGMYRGGSFKGIDLAFGGDGAHAGVLFRALARGDDTLIDGPSLLVDHLLTCTGFKTVAELDRDIGERVAWNQTSPLTLAATTPQDRPVVRSARVGLSLKRTGHGALPSAYLLRPYRYLTEPQRLSKGRVHIVLALAMQGRSAEEIYAATGYPRKSIERWLADFAAGQQEADFSAYAPRDLSTSDLCRMHGIWHALNQRTAP